MDDERPDQRRDDGRQAQHRDDEGLDRGSLLRLGKDIADQRDAGHRRGRCAETLDRPPADQRRAVRGQRAGDGRRHVYGQAEQDDAQAPVAIGQGSPGQLAEPEGQHERAQRRLHLRVGGAEFGADGGQPGQADVDGQGRQAGQHAQHDDEADRQCDPGRRGMPCLHEAISWLRCVPDSPGRRRAEDIVLLPGRTCCRPARREPQFGCRPASWTILRQRFSSART